MILFKIIQQFLEPSVFIFVIILLGFLFLLKRKRIGTILNSRDKYHTKANQGSRRVKRGEVLIITGLILYYSFSISPISDLIISPLESQYKRIEGSSLNKVNKAVLLLGGPESDILRATEAIRLHILNPETQTIITGQNFLNQEKIQALKLKNHLIEQGVKTDNIILEKESRTTGESAKNIKKMLGTEEFFLITSGYHMPRSMELFKKVESNPLPAPTDFKVYKSFNKNKQKLGYNNYNLLDFFPGAQNLKNVDLAFHEYFGLFYSQLTD